MKKATVAGLVTLGSVLAVTLTACGNSNSNSASSSSSTSATKISFPAKMNNTKSSVSGGNLTYGLVMATSFKGIFNEELSTDTGDSTIMQFGAEPLFKTDKNYKIIDGGAANLKLDQKAKTATITINPKAKWSDGQPVVADDVVYAYKILANKETQSQRYTDSLQNIVGLADYHTGKSDQISGIQTPDGGTGKTVVLHFQVMKPGMAYSGNGYYWEAAAPYHYLKDVPFKDLQSSPKIRKNPVFFGPYKLNKLVSGQSTEWVPNEYYYGAKPKLKSITASVVSPNTAPSAIKSHSYDIIGVNNDQYPNVKNTKGVTFIGNKPLSYSYLAFKVGKWDDKKGENVEDKNAKMNDPKLRQAIAYAMNIDQVDQKFYHDLNFRVNTLIPENFTKYYDKSAKGFPYNLKKAEDILDKAGYKKGKDGYRTTPKGKKLTITIASYATNSAKEAAIKNYIQQWKKIGLDVQLLNGRLTEPNSFYDKLQSDSKDIDMYIAGWSLSSEASPNDLYNPKAPFNYGRMNNPEQTKLLADIDSQKAFNDSYRIQAFKKWQEWMNKEAYVVPMTNQWSVSAVNNRVKDYGVGVTDAGGANIGAWADVSVTSNSLQTK
ncbi:oligopeptide ABC transporter substrate-binding protein [Schleiferilactobacillus perolens]|uniref:Oligopeptide ABC transporter solute-binding component n=1 Tax=Schleiferilactobacillus perolens DSM 12744 TaxID=1423792 RepID=A0A0R1MY48_9LACO|nr:oligopeptide ABC transporter substrate-binding protein [Schleiferilactobacillus perolens]KRL12961.1 oligopeptide ABC transporter solute-binding component [Schleiferilactobacillus perolens DSM 12744]